MANGPVIPGVIGTPPLSGDPLNVLGEPRAFGEPDAPMPSPADREAIRQRVSPSIGPQLRGAATWFPSSRQRTQGEIINLTLALEHLGNPFSVRRLPFSILRDMLSDPMIGFAYYYTKIPLMRADWMIKCEDPQIAAAVDEALRPVNPRIQNQICGKLGYGYQPMCKRFKLGMLKGNYRDPDKDPGKDLPIWDSNVPALLWEEPYVLAPEHCLPRWNDLGEFAGFTYSLVPLPNPATLGITEMYGYQDIPGYTITGEFAVWPVNERDDAFGSIYGSPRTKRAYRYWWSYWYRWALADRIFESCADPCKIVYYPTDVTDAIDPNSSEDSPSALSLQQRALEIGASARQGATLALPGDMMFDESSGRITQTRKWAIQYLENKADFSALDSTFTHLDALKFRSMMLPEEAFVQPGQGQRAARNVATQLGELYQQSTVLLADENDGEVNKHFIPQFVAANFPDRADTPCRKQTSGFGQQDADTIRQILQVVGQVKGMVLPVDVRELLSQMGLPLMSEKEQAEAEKQIEQVAASSMPSEAPPEKAGMGGYNSGVQKTQQPGGGESFIYYAGPKRIDLDVASHTGSVISQLPDVPAYKDASVRASMIKLRKVFLDRYQAQVDSFVQHLRDRTTLQLAQNTQQQANGNGQAQQKQGLSASGAAGVAASIVGAWTALQVTEATSNAIRGLLFGIATRAAVRELKQANLHVELDPAMLQLWASRRAQFVVGSVDSTLQSEMTTFLTDELQRETDPDQVAEAAVERFTDTPSTHADRVVMAETLPAYNLGSLTALSEAGVAQVMAHDASDGKDQLTDAECKDRDGEVMTVAEALREAADEHPAGTLYFTALSTDNLRVELVDTLPGDEDSDKNLLARYDRDGECLYVLNETSPEQRREYALAVGGVLTL